MSEDHPEFFNQVHIFRRTVCVDHRRLHDSEPIRPFSHDERSVDHGRYMDPAVGTMDLDLYQLLPVHLFRLFRCTLVW